jgi:dihydrofolate synthase/folylpolyglutamate synthase
MTFESAQSYLLGTINETASRHNPGRLSRMKALLAHLGDPHLKYPTIHVGGTSGKGSTSTMIAAALSASGKRTGLHTKPHLMSITERARIDGIAISEADFGDVLGEMMTAIETTTAEFGRPSYYETLLAIAFVYFERRNVEVAVIEVGIGGTLDGTNLVAPEVCVITNVGLDHMDVLGDTVEEIAADKAGIAKPGVPLVSDASGNARRIIEERCAREGAPFFSVTACASIDRLPSEPYGQTFTVTTQADRYDLALPVLGGFQQRNAATAIVALERLNDELRPSREAIERGFAHLQIPGRMEFFPSHPSVVFDVAHNPDKSASLADALAETFAQRRFSFVVSIGVSKDAPAILRPLFALPGNFIFTTFEAAGYTPERPDKLANIATNAGVSARVIADPVEALAVARRQATPETVVVVTGSTFVAGALRAWWLENVVARSSR